jgi:hypothetical protein
MILNKNCFRGRKFDSWLKFMLFVQDLINERRLQVEEANIVMGIMSDQINFSVFENLNNSEDLKQLCIDLQKIKKDIDINWFR